LPHSNVNEKRLLVGKINGLFGVKGWLKVFSYTDPRKNILKYSPWLVEINGEWKELIIQEGKEHSKTIIAHIENIDDRDLACQFLGQDIYIYKDQLPKLPEGEFYWDDLVGMKVVGLNGYDFGSVKGMHDTGANQVMIVSTQDQKRLIPFSKPYLISTELDKKLITVDWDPEF
jgi:16S rRNA processing protein RimM